MTDPKIELHVHVEGTVRPATLLDIARRNDAPLPVDSVAGVEQLYEYTDFAQFIQVWLLTTKSLALLMTSAGSPSSTPPRRVVRGGVHRGGVFRAGVRAARSGLGRHPVRLRRGRRRSARPARVTMRFTPDLYRGSTSTWPSSVPATRCATETAAWWVWASADRRTGPSSRTRRRSTSPATAASEWFRTPARRPARTRSARSSTYSTRTVSGTGSGPSTTRTSWRRSSAGGWCSTCVPRPTCGPASSRLENIRCRGCGRPGAVHGQHRRPGDVRYRSRAGVRACRGARRVGGGRVCRRRRWCAV